MTVWAIVPVKPLVRAKSRLSGRLSVEERAALSERMLMHTLEVLSAVPEVERTLVVSRDSRALALARDHGANTLSERGTPSLNTALKRATLVAVGYGASAVLVLPADLPLLTREAVDALIACAYPPPAVVLAPDRRGTGTNALLAAPPTVIEFGFGRNSLLRHKARAQQAGVRLELIHLPALSLDIDLPEDLEALNGQEHLVPEETQG